MGLTTRPRLTVRARREKAIARLFDRWASPIYSDIDFDELRLIDPRYVGNRRHADDERAVRLSDLAMLIKDTGVSSDVEGKPVGLPLLLSLYHLLDFNGDGWITVDDLSICLLEAVVDPNDRTGSGPRLPRSLVRGGPRRRPGGSVVHGHVSRRVHKGIEPRRTSPSP